MSSQKLLLKWTTTDRWILSTKSLTLFEVLLNMIVLSDDQILHQSSEGMDPRPAVKTSPVISTGCVEVTWVTWGRSSDIWVSVVPCLAVIKKRRVVSLCVWQSACCFAPRPVCPISVCQSTLTPTFSTNGFCFFFFYMESLNHFCNPWTDSWIFTVPCSPAHPFIFRNVIANFLIVSTCDSEDHAKMW